MVINMQAAAFWRGDIIKQVTIADFFKAGEGSLFNKLKNNPRQSFKSLRNRIQKLQPWQDFINLGLKSNIEKKNYGTNYYIVQAELTKLMGVLDDYSFDMDEKDIPKYRDNFIELTNEEHTLITKTLEDILILLQTAKPSSVRAGRKVKVEDVADARGLSAPDRVRYINLHLKPFKRAVKTTESMPSGFIIYGKGTHKHLKALFEVKQLLQYIKDGNDPKGLDMVEKRLVREIRSELTTDVTIRDINEEGLETKTMSLWDAINFVGHIYGLYGVSDKAQRKKIIAATKQLGQRSKQNRETLEWIGENKSTLNDKGKIEFGWAEQFNDYALLHDFNEYEFVLAEINSVTDEAELAELEQEKNTIEQNITSDFGNEVLEEFKRRITLMTTPRRTYARTPGTTLAEDLSAKQDINITEE